MSTVRIGEFEWDAAKAATNLRKHGVSFVEAMGAFEDPHGYDLADVLHPDRFAVIARSPSERVLTVVYAERAAGGIIRIISARRATSNEKKLYQG